MQNAIEHQRAYKRLVADGKTFSTSVLGVSLRKYQLEPVEALLRAVMGHCGGTYVLQFARQAGKDEALAHLIARLMLLYNRQGGSIVLAAPSAGQSSISKQRLRDRLNGSRLLSGLWQPQGQYSLALGNASATFLTAAEAANPRGWTASLLLVGNEAQDIDSDVWDSRFSPMTASTNAPTLFLGTPWRSDSVLARARKQAMAEEVADGTQHCFMVDWQQVADELPPYRKHVEARAANLGWQHPFMQTEYCLKELDNQGGMFDPHRIGQMHGEHARQMGGPDNGTEKKTYALLVDVAGEAEAEEAEIRSANPRKDSTALTVVEVDVSGPLPVYKVVDRREWLGIHHSALADTLVDLVENVWHAAYMVIDATGVGAGLASFLSARMPGKVQPFIFGSASKSALGWNFLGLVESGRYKDYADDNQPSTLKFWQQVGAAQFEILKGPGKLMRWSVLDPLLHDDLLISAALVAELDRLDLKPRVARQRGYN